MQIASFVNNLFLLFFFFKSELVASKRQYAIERLIDRIFVENAYNPLVRPADKEGITNVFTELKLLQIDLVNYWNNVVF